MNLNELYTSIATDFPVDITDIAGESAKTPNLFVKYIRLHSDETLKYELMENKLKKIIRKRRDYYSGNGTPQEYKDNPFDLKIKNEATMQKYLDGDDEINAYMEQLLIQKQKVEILNHCIKEINQRNWILRVALDDIKFKSGV